MSHKFWNRSFCLASDLSVEQSVLQGRRGEKVGGRKRSTSGRVERRRHHGEIEVENGSVAPHFHRVPENGRRAQNRKSVRPEGQAGQGLRGIARLAGRGRVLSDPRGKGHEDERRLRVRGQIERRRRRALESTRRGRNALPLLDLGGAHRYVALQDDLELRLQFFQAFDLLFQSACLRFQVFCLLQRGMRLNEDRTSKHSDSIILLTCSRAFNDGFINKT